MSAHPLRHRLQAVVLAAIVTGLGPPAATAAPPADDALTTRLRELDPKVLPPGGAKATMLMDDARARLRAANLRENAAWGRVRTKADWETYRDARVRALRESLGPYPPAPKELKVRVVKSIDGDGYRVENLVFESRPGLVVTANLYSPADPPGSMPGILVSHAHHTPATRDELQHIGMTWARQGCLVLVPEHLGHGERRQHPFVRQDQYPGPFRLGRQDYYCRYNTAMQLHLAGESLMGWLVWDLMRGVDVLLSRPGVDKDRIILLGAVAGGGDPAAVMAALDPRVAAVAPYNFGGPQPDYPVPPDAETDFYYFGVPSWESTRCLRNGARDGFAHWLIVGSVAPRRLVYAHEFGWDKDRDPVWPRLEKVFGYSDAADQLAVAAGRGHLKGPPPENTHCVHIGPVHRAGLYPAFKKWFGMEMPAKEFLQHRPEEELACLTPDVVREFKPRPAHELAAGLGAERGAAYRARLDRMPAAERRGQLGKDWAALLGVVEPKGDPKATAGDRQEVDGVAVERVSLEVEPGVVVPLLMLIPPGEKGAKRPVVVGVAQEGKAGFLAHRAGAIADLLRGGAAVCLPDVRGTGETNPGGDRGRTGGRHGRVRRRADARPDPPSGPGSATCGRYSATSAPGPIWPPGTPPCGATPSPRRTPPAESVEVPLDAGKPPALAEPLGGLLALFGALYEDDIRAVSARGGLAGYASVLKSPFCHVPHDAVVPGALTLGDLGTVAAVVAPRRCGWRPS